MIFEKSFKLDFSKIKYRWIGPMARSSSSGISLKSELLYQVSSMYYTTKLCSYGKSKSQEILTLLASWRLCWLGQRAKTAAATRRAILLHTQALGNFFYSHQTVFVFTQTLLQPGPALPSLAENFICAINLTEKSRGKQNKLKTERA